MNFQKERPLVNRPSNRWATLAVVATAQFAVVLDVTIVTVTLPDMQRDLQFTGNSLQWVISAYTLLFGGFLLLGGRAADLLGRRRVFLIGLGLFGLASLLAGLASSPLMLIVLRAVQGLGGAMLSPAALSIVTVTFPHGRQRNLALGVWGGLSGLGGTLGVVAGGALVDRLGWRWVFFVNVPIVVALIVLAPVFVLRSRGRAGARGLDVAGALLSTCGLLSIIFGVIRADTEGWSSVQVFALSAVGVVSLAVFVVAESRSAAPLVPLHLFSSRGLSLSIGAFALTGAAFLSMFFLMVIFLQQVRGLSALEIGFAFLPMGFASISGALLASRLVTAVGTRRVQTAAAIIGLAGLLLLARVSADGDYVTQILPGLVLFGVSVPAVFTPAQIVAVADVSHEHAGSASGVITAGQQVGGAVGLAVITTLATTHTAHLLASGAGQHDALVGGFHRGLVIAGAFAAASVLVALASPTVKPAPETIAESSVPV
jgi:EmrB/QacA subfamily drug resistance transporter